MLEQSKYKCATVEPMSVFKRTRRTPSGELEEISPYWHYRFMRNGASIFFNTKQKDKDTAKTMEGGPQKKAGHG